MGLKKMIFGEEMPDKDDPKYKERREKEIEAGKKAARILRVDKAAARIQKWALKYPRLFLCTVFGIVTMCLGYNISCMVKTYKHQPVKETAVERQDAALGRIRKEDRKPDMAEIYENNLKSKMHSLTKKGKDMTAEDSMMVRFLLEEMMKLEQLKTEKK